MINNLKELNEKINSFVDHVVKTACENTTSGNYFVSVEDAYKMAGMGYDDFLEYRDLIIGELHAREEVLDFDYSEDSLEFDVNCALDYCPHYEWSEGDEEIFGCTYDEWLNRPVKDVYQAVAQSNSQDIVGTITYNDSGEVVEYTDKEKFIAAYKSALDSMGPMGCTAKVSSEDDFELRYQIDKIIYAEFGDSIEPFEQWKASREGLTAETINSDSIEPGIYFTIRDGFGDDIGEKSYPTFEKALKVFQVYCAQHGEDADGAMLGIVCKTDEKTHKCVLVQNVLNKYNESVLKPMYNNISWDTLAVPEIELAALKGKQIQYPFDETTQKRIDALEKMLGIYDRDIDTTGDLYVGKWRVHVVAPGEHYGLNNNLTHDVNTKSMVEFWDMSVKKGDFPDGQFVSRYYIETLLEDKWGAGPDELMKHGLCLDGLNADVWSVSGAEMTKVYEWLKNRPYKQGEHYLECHGDVDVPVWRMERHFGPDAYVPKMAGELLMAEVLTTLPFVKDLSVEPIGPYRDGYGFSVSFVCQANKETVDKSLKQVLEGYSHRFNTEEKVVKAPKEPLDKVINSCEKLSKKDDIQNNKEHFVEKGER